MWWLLLVGVAAVVGQNCSTGDNLCSVCEKIGNNSYTKSLYTEPYCSVLYIVGDHNTVNNTIDRCVQSFNSSYNLGVTCQLPVFTDTNLVAQYNQTGLRSSSLTYFIGLVRGGNCSPTFYYQAANGFQTPAKNSTASCDATRGVFEGMTDKEVNPSTYTTNSFLCQCALDVDDLPGTQSGFICITHLVFFFSLLHII